MKTITITAADLDGEGFCLKPIEYECRLVIEAGLGCVRFRRGLYVAGALTAKAGSGIEAGDGIKAGSSIESGLGIKAGWGIEAGSSIEAGSGIEAGDGIKAGSSIEAGSGIKAGWGIKAGEGIKAGDYIEAGWGIEAGLSIVSRTIAASLRIFAGQCIWRLPLPEEIEIRAKLISGTVAFGTLVEPADTEETN